MNLQWILLAFFLSALVWEICKAITRPMHKNVLNLISIMVAFTIAFILQVAGLFQHLALNMVNSFGATTSLGENGGELASAMISTFFSPVLFVIVFCIFYAFIRLIHVNFISKIIEKNQAKKEKRLLDLAIQEEREFVEDIVAEDEKELMGLINHLENSDEDYDVDDYLDDYRPLKRNQIKRMVKRRIKKEKRALKKHRYFKESKQKKAISVISGAVSGFLILAILMTPVFYTMSVLSDVTDTVSEDAAQDNKIYHFVNFVDDNFVAPYEETFVYQIYDSMAIDDLMVRAVEIGGRININGQETNASDFVRKLLTSVVTLATQLTAKEPNGEALKIALTDILQHPIVNSALYDLISSAFENIEIETPENADILVTIKNEVLKAYKDMSQEEFNAEIDAIRDFLVAMIEKQIVAKLIAGELSFDTLLSDKETIKSLLGPMASLSVYDVIMSSAFNEGVELLAPVLGVPANNADAYNAFLTSIAGAANNVSAMSNKEIAELENFFANASSYGSIYAYIHAPIDSLTQLQNKSETLKNDAASAGEAIEAITAEIASFRETALADGKIDASEQATLDSMLARENELIEEEEQLLDKVELLMDEVKTHVEDVESRVSSITGFIKHFTNWMTVQKPFMIASEDKSIAAISLEINGVTYVCNTDCITIETLADIITDGFKDSVSGNVSDESSDDFVNQDLEQLLEDLPFSGILKELNVRCDEDTIKHKASPIADLINYLIDEASYHKNTSTEEIDVAWVKAELADFKLMNVGSADALALADKILSAYDNAESFEYLGITVADMKECLHFGDDWTTDLRVSDSEQLANIIFTIVDIIGSLGEDGEEGGESGEDKIDSMLGILSVFGKALDLMDDTHCLNGLPEVMLKALLKNEMLSVAMTPSMLNDYMNQMEAEDFSYEAFMNDLADTFTGVLDKINGQGGSEEQ